MKRFAILWVFLLALPAIHALECQYTVPEEYLTTVNRFYTEDHRPLVDFITIGEPREVFAGNDSWIDIPITNKESVIVRLKITYWEALSNGTHNISTEKTFIKELRPYEAGKIATCVNTPSCSLIREKTEYEIMPTAQVIIRAEKITLLNDTCKSCGAYLCLNDGSPCVTGSECGSGACYNGTCISSCPDGATDCGGRCAQDEDCTLGVCDTNRGICAACFGDDCDCRILGADHIKCPDTAACIIPGSKENSEGYACTQECASGYGEDGVCMMTPEDTLKKRAYWIVGFTLFIIIVGLVMKYGAYDRGVRKKGNELDEKKKKLQDAENELSVIKRDKERNEKMKEEVEKERAEIKKTDEENKTARKKVEEDSRETYIKTQTEKYKKEYGSGVYYDEKSERLRIRFKDGKDYPLHRHIYYTKIRPVTGSEEVHHIDNEELNNEKWNLIALNKTNHNKEYTQYCKKNNLPHLIHGKITRRNWESGMQQLQEQLNMKEKDFQENKHLIQHVRETNFSFK